MGAHVGTPRHLQSWLPWKSNPWDLCLGGQSLLRCGPLQTGHGAGSGLDGWGQPAWDAPAFHSNNKSLPFHLGDSGLFSSSCFRANWTAVLVFQSFAWFFVFVFVYFPPHILYHNILSEPAAKSFFKDWFVTNTCFHNSCQIYGAVWVRNLSFKIIPPSIIAWSTSVNLQRAYHSLY